MTETAKIAANNAYHRQLAEADAAYTDGITELSNYVRQEQERLDDKAKAEQAERYNEIMSAVQNGEYNTTADLERYLGINESKDGFGEGSIAADLSDFQKANLLNMYQTRASDPEQIEADKEYSQTHNEDGSEKKVVKTNYKGAVSGLAVYTEGNNFTVGGYEVELGEPVGESVVPAASVSTMASGTVFAYNGDLFIKVGSKVYTVRDRDHGYTSDDYKDALNLIEGGTIFENKNADSNTASANTVSATPQTTGASNAGSGGQKTTQKTEVKRQGNYIYYSDGTKRRYK